MVNKEKVICPHCKSTEVQDGTMHNSKDSIFKEGDVFFKYCLNCGEGWRENYLDTAEEWVMVNYNTHCMNCNKVSNFTVDGGHPYVRVIVDAYLSMKNVLDLCTSCGAQDRIKVIAFNSFITKGKR